MKSVLVPSLLLSSFCAAAAAADFYPTEEQTPANNPAVMHLFPEGGEVHGWISGLEDLEGQQVVFGDTGGGTATIGAGNRFHFKAGGDKSKTCTVSLGNLQRTITIPPAQADAPVAFFVIDRSVFRPNTELQFAAFLRQADADGKWRPLQRDSVEVEIESVSKNITVAKLQLAPDDFGRVTGSYTFAKADPLDDYRISVDGLGGSASVKVAEFRKAKVRLDIGSQRDGDTLTLKFRALDLLNKPVPASKLRFTARVVTAAQLIAELSAASRNGTFRKALTAYTQPHVLVVDEVGYLTYGSDAANVLFHVVNDRHIRRRAMVFTTNESPLTAWGEALHDHDLADAIVDRILERGRLLALDGPSYRTRHINLDQRLESRSAQPARVSGIDRPEFLEPTQHDTGIGGRGSAPGAAPQAPPGL